MHRRIHKSSLLLMVVLAAGMLLAACTGAVPAQVAQLAERTPAATATETAAPAEEPAPAEATAEPAEEAAPTPEATPAEERAGSALEGVTWQVVDYLAADGTVATPVAPATVTFQNGQVAGNTGCNGFFASYTVDGSALTITLGGMTAMACEEALMAQEQAILAALGATASYAVADAQVTLLDSEGAVLLTLSAQTSSGLTNVVWRATNYNNGREAVVGMLENTEITAIFDEEGALSGSAGCNNYVAGYTTDGNQITIGPAASTMMFCAEPEGVMEQEAAYLAALATAATYSINGQVLEMRTADDALALRFEVATDSVVAPEAPASADPDPVAADAEGRACCVRRSGRCGKRRDAHRTGDRAAWRQHPRWAGHAVPHRGCGAAGRHGRDPRPQRRRPMVGGARPRCAE